MRLTALIFYCLLIGCSDAASVMPSQPGNTAPVAQPHAIGGWTLYPLAISIGFQIIGGHDGDLYGYGYSNGAWDELVKVDPLGNETPIHISGGVGCSAYELIAPNPDGNMYAIETLQTGAQAVAQVTPQGGVTEFPLPYTDCSVGMVSGSDGNLWIVHQNGVGTMTTTGQYTEFGGGPFGAVAGASRIVRGSDKNLWFNDYTNSGNTVIRISVSNGAQTMFPLPSDATDLTEGPRGILYMMGNGQIYQVNMDGAVVAYPVAPANTRSILTLGTKGRLFWSRRDRVFFFNATTHQIQRRVAAPYGSSNILTVSPDHTKLWLILGSDAAALTL